MLAYRKSRAVCERARNYIFAFIVADRRKQLIVYFDLDVAA